MAWNTALEAIRASVALAVGSADYTGANGNTYGAVQWENHPQAERWDRSGIKVDLRLGVVDEKCMSPEGETRYEVAEDVDAYLHAVSVSRLAINVSILITTNSQVPGSTAPGHYAARLRRRLGWPDAAALLQAADVALTQVDATFNADYLDQDGFVRSAAIIDVRFEYTETDTQPTPVYDIETIEGSLEAQSLDSNGDPETVVTQDFSLTP